MTEILVVPVLVEHVDGQLLFIGDRLIRPHLVGLLLPAIVTVDDEDDTLFLGQISIAEELSKVTGDEVSLGHLVNDLLKRSVANVLLLVEDAGKELQSRTGECWVLYLL